MKFLLDANIPRSATRLMRDQGQDTVHVNDTPLRGAADEEIAQYARSEQRIVVTRDLDFADVRRYPPEASPGYLVIRVPDTWVAREINQLLGSFFSMDALVSRMPSHLVVLSPRQVRFRPALDAESAAASAANA